MTQLPPDGKSADSPPPNAGGGLFASLGAALAAALTTGLLFGVLDGVVADSRVRPPYGALGYLGCFAAAVLAYSLLYGLVLGLLALASHAWLRRRPAALRFRALLAIGFSTGLFLELYWWTRPYLFYGHSSVSPERLVSAVVLAVVALGLGHALALLLVRAPRALHVTLRVIAICALVGGAMFMQSEGRKVASRGQISDRNREMPNVLLVIVDALRADMLGCYGNQQVSTPVIDSLAERGVLFENCFVQAPYTWTSFGSILTGKYPRRHGLVAQMPGVRMVQSNVTLPFHLKTAQHTRGFQMRDEDYAAGTFMTGALSHGSGLDKGFDVYTEALMGHDVVEVDSQWSVFRSELLAWIFKAKIQQRVDSSLVVTHARHWLGKNRERRWMAMVHLYSTHTPYDPPQRFRDMYLDPGYSGPIKAFYASYREAIESGEYEPTEADVEQIRALYHAGVSQADAMIGELLEELEGLGVLENTLVIVTSDHGEDLGERAGYWEHNHMWQTNLRVPLVMANSFLLPHGKRVSALVESVDILPTVCDLLELDLPREASDDPRSRIDGVSLRPLVRDEGSPSIKRYSFSENNLFASVQDARAKLIVPRLAPSDLLAPELPEQEVFSERHFVRFFDLERDPEEFENRIRQPASQADVKRLYRALREWSEGLPIPESENFSTSRDRDHIQVLSDLGYAGMMNRAEEAREKAGESEEDD